MRPIADHWRFFCWTFLWSWGFFVIPITLSWGMDNPTTRVLFALGGVAPSSFGILLAYLKRDKAYWRDFWSRTLNFRQIRGTWYLIIFTVIPVTSLAAVLVNYLLTGLMPGFATLGRFLANPLQILPFAVYMLLLGPLAEEIGWRGFALDHLEQRHNQVVSSLLLGLFWALWHLPMFFIRGTYQYDLLNRSFLLFVDFNVAIFAMSIIMDWVYNSTGRSILSGILVHFCTNFFGELLDLPDTVMLWRTGIQILLAVIILVFGKAGWSSLARRQTPNAA